MRKTEVNAVNQLGGVFPNFEEYLNGTQGDMFRYAYQCGYEAATTAFTKGGVA